MFGAYFRLSWNLRIHQTPLKPIFLSQFCLLNLFCFNSLLPTLIERNTKLEGVIETNLGVWTSWFNRVVLVTIGSIETLSSALGESCHLHFLWNWKLIVYTIKVLDLSAISSEILIGFFDCSVLFILRGERHWHLFSDLKFSLVTYTSLSLHKALYKFLCIFLSKCLVVLLSKKGWFKLEILLRSFIENLILVNILQSNNFFVFILLSQSL